MVLRYLLPVAILGKIPSREGDNCRIEEFKADLDETYKAKACVDKTYKVNADLDKTYKVKACLDPKHKKICSDYS